ncbi:MAG: electron transport complex subunit RsxE, partial [Treponema sp.]|nr:electron transport complex subunit RsxE [Treponema sp.]
ILPDEIRIAAAVVIVAGFVTVLQLYLEAYAPAELRESLGIFIPLIVVNCILFGRIEAFASKNGFVASAVDAFGMGAGLTLGLVVIGVFRELFGSGSFFGLVLQPVSSSHMLIMIMPAGAFFTLGIIILLIKYSKIKKGGNQ